MKVASATLGNIRVLRVGFGVPPKRTFSWISFTPDDRNAQRKCAIARKQSPAHQTRGLPGTALAALLIFARSTYLFAQADPASEPAVLAVAKVLPAVVNINTERVVRRTVRDPFEDFYAQFFGYNRVRPHEIRQTLQSLGSGFIVDPAGYIITNQHVVDRKSVV